MVSVVCGRILKSIPELISKTFPIPGKFRSKLPSDIAELSQLLTSSRGDRSLSYLSRPNYLSAYLHYFLPWNILRLCILLPKLDLKLSDGDTITDYGCGPLTFASALWISRPDLRNVSLEINCVDKVASVLEAGKKFFTALAASEKWKINLIKKDINIGKRGSHNDNKDHDNSKASSPKSALVCAVNMFNEMYDRIAHNNIEELRRMAGNAASFLHREAAPNGAILTVEPGVPQSGRFISYLREALIETGHFPLSPCTHSNRCPMMRETSQQDTRSQQQNIKHKKDKWCHFAFDANDAPKELNRLSSAARLPKDRLVFSFLLTRSNAKKTDTKLNAPAAKSTKTELKPTEPADNSQIRVLSDAFTLPYNKLGRYGCSQHGLVLLAGNENVIEKLEPLSLAPNEKRASKEAYPSKELYDEKSGALIIEVT